MHATTLEPERITKHMTVCILGVTPLFGLSIPSGATVA